MYTVKKLIMANPNSGLAMIHGILGIQQCYDCNIFFNLLSKLESRSSVIGNIVTSMSFTSSRQPDLTRFPNLIP